MYSIEKAHNVVHYLRNAFCCVSGEYKHHLHPAHSTPTFDHILRAHRLPPRVLLQCEPNRVGRLCPPRRVLY